jgi:hypothetical protein
MHEDVEGIVERRREERSAIQAGVELELESEVRMAELRDISTNGAFLATSPATQPAGSGLHLEFTLPQGFRVNAFGRIVWVRAESDDLGPSGYGVQFYGLDDVNREFIQYYLDLAKMGQGGVVATGRVETLFEVREHGSNQLHIRMTGALTPLEADSLEEVVCRKLGRIKDKQLYVYIDARGLGACSKSALEHIHTWLERLRHNRQLFGVMLGGTSIGVVQVRRLAREAGIADSIMMFTEQGEAETFWGTLIRAQSYRPLPLFGGPLARAS